MLSAESAAGKYPVESVTMQQLIINKVEVSRLVTAPILQHQREPSQIDLFFDKAVEVRRQYITELTVGQYL